MWVIGADLAFEREERQGRRGVSFRRLMLPLTAQERF